MGHCPYEVYYHPYKHCLVVLCILDCCDKACGIDVHRKKLFVSVLARGGVCENRVFKANLDEYFELKDWLEEQGCMRVAMEATGVYWYSLYLVLSERLEVIVANPKKIKHTPGRKTDQRDSEWLAELCLNGMIEPSRVFTGWDRELRELTRHRENLVGVVSQFKNRVLRSLELCSIKLGLAFSDSFGTTGRLVLEGLLDGRSIEAILSSGGKRVKKKEAVLVEAVQGSLDPVSVDMIRFYLGEIDRLRREIETVDGEILHRLKGRRKDLAVLLSIPGMGRVSASAILSEIGRVEDFQSGEQLASYFGIVPEVYQSAEKNRTGRITKQGSRHMRRMLIQVAHVISRMHNKLSLFFHKVRGKKGSKVAAVALARKLLCIIHHLLTNGEKYQEEGFKAKKINLKIPAEPQITMSIDEMIQTITKAGYEVKKKKGLGV